MVTFRSGEVALTDLRLRLAPLARALAVEVERSAAARSSTVGAERAAAARSALGLDVQRSAAGSVRTVEGDSSGAAGSTVSVDGQRSARDRSAGTVDRGSGAAAGSTLGLDDERSGSTAPARTGEPRRPMPVTERHARMLVEQAAAYTRGGDGYGPGISPDVDEQRLLDQLAEHARETGITIPADLLAAHGVAGTDLEVLLVAAAPAFERAFGGVYAHLQDAFDATAPGPQLLVRLLATSPDDERRVNEAAGPFGLLRSSGLLQAVESDRATGPLLRPAAGVVELLRGSSVDLGLLGLLPPDDLRMREPAGVDPDDLWALADALDTGEVDVVGVWGAGQAGSSALVSMLCGQVPAVRVRAALAEHGLQRAAIAGVPCVLDVEPEATDEDRDALGDVLARSTTPVVLVASEPLRLSRLWTARRVAELVIPPPGRSEVRQLWADAFPVLADDDIDDLARRFALGVDEVAAVSTLDATARSWASNGSRPSLGELAARVSRPRSARLAMIRTPRRGLDLLVLPEAEQRRVLTVAGDFRAWPRVAEAWRLDRFGTAGITALFAGPPGTGKTLAAEVIAGEVGLDLMLVDLSLLVSKWVGETEKNLDAVFTEAGRSHCVLFFDEADALFGRRGEVDRGADRYANLEVGYLLQRLDRYEGLVVLATNLRDQLDEAFTRRFDHMVHFPRPGPAERRRLWQLMLGPPVEVTEQIDHELLTELDLTGAGIAAVVRSAALGAHHQGRRALTMVDLVGAVSRQFQREARLVPRDLLGSYAEALG